MKRISPTKSQGIRAAHTLKLLLKKNGIPVREVLLFGSIAKGGAHENSDIDLAVIHEPFGADRFDELRTMCRAERGSDLQNIEVVYFHSEDMEDKYSTIVQELKKYGIAV
jgi:predicted nucleotidyltransferase